ncbi:MAG: hypothetical protein U9R07_04095 [Pseudomonadota bacterium]|nr:hypothetical protein [Pseudomonadota bacterium]
MTTSFADGLSEEEFRRSIEARLRENRPEEAIARLRRHLASEVGPGGILPDRFMTVQSSDLVLEGWEELGTRIRAHDEPGRPITAISIAFGWPGEDPPQPDEHGHLRPLVEVEYFNDSAYPFSESDRDNLLEGYSYYGCTWAGEGKATERTLILHGIDDLHGALAQLEARLLAMDVPDEDEIRAGSLGACLLSVLLFQAVRDAVARDGLPRPVCVMAGSNGVYPYFDAPVTGMPEHALKDDAADANSAAAYIPGPRYSSLLVTGIPRARKRAVLVVEETETETAARIANLRGLHHRDAEVHEPAAEPAFEPIPELAEVAVPDDGTIIPNPNGPLLVKKKPSHSWDFRDLLTPESPADEPDYAEPDLPEPPRDWMPVEEEPEAFAPDLTDDFAAPVPEHDASVAKPEWDYAPVPEQDEPALPPEQWRPEPEPAEPEAEADWDLPPEPPLPPVFVAEAVAKAPAAPSRVEPGFTSFEIDLDIESRLKALIAAQTFAPEPEPLPELDLEPELEPEPEPVVEAKAAQPEFGPAWPLGIGWLEDAAEPEAVEAPAPRPSLLTRLLSLLPWRR